MSTTARRPRSDGLRNRAALLVAADAVFAADGTGASLSAVAARAGVAIGTLYKHFPTRRNVVGALLADRHDALFATRPDGLADWVRTVASHAATYRGLAEFLASDLAAGGGPDAAGDRLAADCARMAERTDRLVAEARAAGSLAEDVPVEDVVTLMNAAAWVREQEGSVRADRLITAGLAGMRPGAREWNSGDGRTPTRREPRR
ncbi:TetR/AcrR family transcriptional regulator [Pseudonocardia endophytica]|uniref:TetR family transcriptional regulator n=1 Tax=Pseudonocardia endophytica TaxID=401976 RepID=A0A4V2PHU5_PSEEN|nr:TetR family transcriptional regulator [Pseudonocardia endophytica]TCK22136.1 TetR family transcriptional regulator [Pseudonocardia endophytica]